MAELPGVVRGCVRNQNQPHKIHFFSGDRHWRYDLRRDYGEAGGPLPMSEWPFAEPFASGIDAVVDRRGSSLSYFFKGDQYLDYDWTTKTVTLGPRPLAEWHHSLTEFAGGVDAAVNGEAGYIGRTYFFKGDIYFAYDWRTDTAEGPAPVSHWHLGPGFEGGITACFTRVEFGRPKTYFFKQGRYVRYDWGRDRADAGYPQPTAAGWPSGLAVWAEHTRAPLYSCADARLEGGEDRVRAYPDGTAKGQAGWQLGVRFADPAGLAAVLEGATIPTFYGDEDAGGGPVGQGSITRLGLVAGGTPGSLDTGADAEDDEGRLSPSTLSTPALRADLERVGKLLAAGAPVVLFGGDYARDAAGDALLKELSLVWPGHPVTGFTRPGHPGNGTQRRPGERCDNPGLHPAGEDDVWAHEDLPRHRKTALDGGIVDAHD